MTKQIPESRIALNPVVTDDSKRGLPPQNNIPPDIDALLAWLKEQALEAHNRKTTANYKNDFITYGLAASEFKAYTRVIAKIENSRINQRPHVPQGWNGVGNNV